MNGLMDPLVVPLLGEKMKKMKGKKNVYKI